MKLCFECSADSRYCRHVQNEDYCCDHGVSLDDPCDQCPKGSDDNEQPWGETNSAF